MLQTTGRSPGRSARVGAPKLRRAWAPGSNVSRRAAPARDKYFRGSMDFGAMMEAATVLGALQGAFTTLVTQMSGWE